MSACKYEPKFFLYNERKLFNQSTLATMVGSRNNERCKKGLALYKKVHALLSKRLEAYFLKEKCTDCNFCVALCPSGAITRDGEIHYNDDLCLGCCGCMNVCPTNAWRCSKIDPENFYKGINVKRMAVASGRLPPPAA